MESFNNSSSEIDFNLKKEIFKYLTFWKFFLMSITFFLFISFFYIKYTNDVFFSSAKIKVLDRENSSFELPTASNLFKNSKINMENETEILTSYPILYQVVDKLNLQYDLFVNGDIMSARVIEFPFPFEIVDNYHKVNEEEEFTINFNDNTLSIRKKTNHIDTVYFFSNLNTYNNNHDLPFNLKWEK